ncbi:MAG: hypothetical protein ACI4LB_01355 [Candidatus Fimenecus sp.]
MKKRVFALAVAFVLVFTLLFSGCGEEKAFEKVEVPSTEEASETVPETTASAAAEGTFTFAASIKMGMTITEVQRAIGQVANVEIVDERKSFSNEFSGVFINYSTTKSVVFMFDQQTERLEQMQFRGNINTDGADTAAAIKLFDARYGKQAVYQSKYVNHIWKSDDVYILLSELDENNYAVTYTEQTYFEEHYTQETDAYNRVR